MSQIRGKYINGLTTLLAIIIICLIFGFRQNDDTQPEQPFFADYTQVIHFRYPASYNDLMLNYYQKNGVKTNYPSILFDQMPDTLDPNLPETLFHLGFVRNELKKKDFDTVDSLFSYRKADISIQSECLPIYRDILIFRKKKVVKGIVQLCFGCNQFNMVGAKGKTNDFGQNGEFKRLQEILSK